MENDVENVVTVDKNKSKNNMVVGVIVLVLIVIGFIWLFGSSKKAIAPNEEVAPVTDTTTSINEDLNKINVDSGAEADLNSLDTDLENL